MLNIVSLERLSVFKDKVVNLLNGKVNKSGDTMTGDLSVGSAKVQTNGYLLGTWLQTTAATYLTSKCDFAVLNGGWIYKQTPEKALEMMGGATKPTVVTSTLSAGSTSITLSNSAITTDSVIDIYTSVYGVNPTSISVSAGSITLTFDAQSNAVNIRIEVK